MGQFHVAQLFPAHHGLVSSLYVGSFIASGVIFEVARAIFSQAGGHHSVYRIIMIGLGSMALPFAFLMAWMAPTAAFKKCDRYHFSLKNFAFRVESLRIPTHASFSEAASEAGTPIGSDHGGKTGLCTHGNNDAASVIPPIHDPCSSGRNGVSEQSRVESGPQPVQLQAAPKQDPGAHMQPLWMEDKNTPSSGCVGEQACQACLPEQPPSGDVVGSDVTNSQKNTSAATELGKEHALKQYAESAGVSNGAIRFTSVSKAGVAQRVAMVESTTRRPVHARFALLDTSVSLCLSGAHET
jgi:hypothetical protein